jgi:hypothetical protein
MRRVCKPSSDLNIGIPGWCCTTSGRLAQEPLPRPFQQHTSSSSCVSLGSHVVFSDLRIQLSAGQIISPSSERQQLSAHISPHQRAPPGRISSLSGANNDNASGSPSQPSFLEWARNPFFNTRNRQNDEGIELAERRTEAVDVPLGQARPVSPFFSHLDVRLYIHHVEVLHGKEGEDGQRESKECEGGRETEGKGCKERKERKEIFCGKLAAFPEQCHPTAR